MRQSINQQGMKPVIPFLFLPLFAINLFAQEPCNEDIIMAIKGKWTKRPDATMKAGNQTQITGRLDKMQHLLQSAYPEPKGIEAAWYRSMGGHNSSVSSNAESYVLNASFKTYYCNSNVKKLLLGTETGNWFYLWVNKFSWFAGKDDNFLIEHKPVYLLTKKLGELKGFPLYAGSDNSTSNTGTTFSKAVLISRQGQLPYTPVSRKQYLSSFLKNKESQHKQYIESLLKMPVRSDTEEEAYKQQQMERVANQERTEQTKEKAKANFLRGYKTAKQRQQDDINRVKEVYQRDIKAAQDYLTHTAPEELAKPAYLFNYGYSSSFKEFANEKEGLMMVQVNSHYFNNKLPAHVPQFLVVYWRWNAEKPSLDFANQIEKNFNFKALQQMLDK
ncbi:MAG: hypothetical protein ACXWV1_03265 [Chitinophagaceae bacterium]